MVRSFMSSKNDFGTSSHHVFCAMPGVVLRSPDSVAKLQAQSVLLPARTLCPRARSDCGLLRFPLWVALLEEEAGPRLLALCKAAGHASVSPLTAVPGPASLVGGVSVEPASLPALGLCETERQATAHTGTETVVLAFWWGAEFKVHINHPAEAKACFPDWCIYKLENCGKPQPTNCDAHWFFALGFDVLPDKNNNYVTLTRLPSVHASHCTCAYKRCCSADALSLTRCSPTCEHPVICADVSFFSLAFQNGPLKYEVFQTQEESVTLPLTPFSPTSYLNWTFNILPAALQPHMVHCCHSPDCIFDTQALSNLQQTKRPPPGAAHGEGVTPTAL